MTNGSVSSSFDGSTAGSSSSNNNPPKKLNHKNQNISYKTPQEQHLESLQLKRTTEVKSQAFKVRELKGGVKRLNVPSDSCVAEWVLEQEGKREEKKTDGLPKKSKKLFAPPRGGTGDFDPGGKFFEEDKFWKDGTESLRVPGVSDVTSSGLVVGGGGGGTTTTSLLDDPRYLRLDQSLLPLHLFDSGLYSEKDKSPQEWLDSGSGGSCCKFDGVKWKWRRVKVEGYSEEGEGEEEGGEDGVGEGSPPSSAGTGGMFTVVFVPSGVRKKVSRLNLLFDQEDKSIWEARREVASALREETKQALRFGYFVRNSERVKGLGAVKKEVLFGIHKCFAGGLPPSVPFPDPGKPGSNLNGEVDLVRELTGEIIKGYDLAMRTAVVHYLLENDEGFLEEYNSLKLPEIPEKLRVREFGKVLIPEHEFVKNGKVVRMTHYSAVPEVFRSFVWFEEVWQLGFEGVSFCDTKMSELTLPCSLEEFNTLQEGKLKKVGEALTYDWRRSFTEHLVDNIQDTYDFFQSSLEVYKASSLCRVLKHAELRMAQQLRVCLEKSVNEWVDLVKEYSLTPSPGSTTPNTAAAVTNGKPPLLKSSLVLTEEGVSLSPTPLEIEGTLISTVEKMVEKVRGLQTVDSDLMSLLRLPSRVIYDVGGGGPTTSSTDTLISSCKSLISEKVKEATAGAEEVARVYDQYFYLVDIDVDDYVETYCEGVIVTPGDPSKGTDDVWEKPDVTSYFEKVREFHLAAKAIESKGYDFELFSLVEVDTTVAKDTLVAKALDLRDALLDRLVNDAREENFAISDEYEGILSRVSEKPVDEVELSALKEYIGGAKETVSDLVTRVESIHHRLHSMEEFCYHLTEEDVSLMWSIKEFPSKVDAAAAEAQENLENDKVKMMDQLALEKEKFEQLLESFDVTVKKCTLFSDYTIMEKNNEEINSLMDSIEQAEAQAVNFNMREKVFGFPPTEYPGLKACRKELTPFHKLWNMITDFNQSRQEWLHGSFLELDANEIESNVTDWWKLSYKMSKSLEDDFPGAAECASQLRSVTTEFRENLPVIRSLASKALKPRHWEEISEKLGQEIEPSDDDFTLQTLLDYNVSEHIEAIEEICVAAEKQYGLEKALEAMKVEWNVVEFIVKEYKETGTCVVGGVDDIVTLLDDHIVKTQTMRGSPFIKPIENDCKAWEVKLKYAQALIEEWVNCQRTWMYLEPIFSSDDIMRQLPTESKRYQSVDALWKKTMRECKDEPNFLIQADAEKSLEQKFKAANKKLEEIQKGLADYLEMKRLYFPRFFFLSNDELLEILSQTKDPRAVQHPSQQGLRGDHSGQAREGPQDYTNDLLRGGEGRPHQSRRPGVLSQQG